MDLPSNPYAPPATGEAGRGFAARADFVPIDGRVLATTIALGFTAISQALWLIGLYAGLVEPGAIDREDLEGLTGPGLAALVLAALTALAILATVVCTALTLPRANRNARLLAGRLRFSPGATVWWHIVPLFNLFRPYQVMAELWVTSEPSAEPVSAARAPAPWVGLWWASWLAANLAGRLEERVWKEDLGLASVLIVLSALLYAHVLRALARRQRERYRRLEAAGRFPWPRSPAQG